MAADQITLPRSSRAVPTPTRLVTRRLPVTGYLAVLLLPVLVVGGSMATGWWSTAGHGGVGLSGGGQGVGRGAGDGAGDGAGRGNGAGSAVAGVAAPASPADVKGSMTVRHVVDAFPPVTVAEVLAVFGAAPDTGADTQLKTLVKQGSGTELPAFRAWLEERQAR